LKPLPYDEFPKQEEFSIVVAVSDRLRSLRNNFRQQPASSTATSNYGLAFPNLLSRVLARGLLAYKAEQSSVTAMPIAFMSLLFRGERSDEGKENAFFC
jgi:hypothetical protein